jgi:hypothetical protein
MFTKQDSSTGKFVADEAERTSQDLAYGMTGIGFYYYLTHDEAVLKKIILLKKYIFSRYFHQGKGVFMWLPQENNSKEQSIELVAHLDQLYAYMIWLKPALPAAEKAEFMTDMCRIADMMIERFYSEAQGIFWAFGQGYVGDLPSRHLDRGNRLC